jgi:glycosyltransferase involved in cell wall biosynthesis
MTHSYSPLVSVIIPAFNREDTIVQAVSSALQQSYPSLEVIVVDDGSTDATAQVIQQHFPGRVVLLSQHNKGQSEAIRVGLSAARGEVIAFLDADDFWATDKMQLQVEVLQSNPGICAVYTDAEEFTEHGNERRSFIAAHPSLRNESALMQSMVACHVPLRSTVAARRSFLDDCGIAPDPLCKGQDDIQMFMEMLGSGGRFSYLDRITTFRRLHASNISGNHVYRFTRRIGTYQRLLERCSRFSVEWKRQVQNALSDAEFRVGEYHFGLTNTKEARTHFRNALAASPTNWLAYYYLGLTMLPSSSLAGLRILKRQFVGRLR